MHVQGGVREESLEEGHEFMRQTHLPLGMNNERLGAAALLYLPSRSARRFLAPSHLLMNGH
jgi:hypothetical protein